MELKRIKYFVTAAHELSFSGAARKLGVSQPVLSRGIKELEAHVGAKLFNRSTTEISLTEVGETFLPDADEALLTLEQAILSIRKSASKQCNNLSISYHPVVLEPFVGPAMSVFKQTFENVGFKLHEVQTQRESINLQGGKIDISFHCYYENDDFGSEFGVFDIGQIDNCVILSSNHPLAGAESVSLKELSDLEFIGFPSLDFPLCVRAIKDYFESQGVTYRPIMEANSPHSMISTVISGGSFAVMTFLGTTIAPRSVSFVPLRPPGGMSLKYGALVRRDESRKLVLAFLQECRRIAETRVPQMLEQYTAERTASAPPVQFRS